MEAILAAEQVRPAVDSLSRRYGEVRRLSEFLCEPLSAEEYQAYLPTVLPSAADKETLRSIMKEKDWVVPKKPEELVQ